MSFVIGSAIPSLSRPSTTCRLPKNTLRERWKAALQNPVQRRCKMRCSTQPHRLARDYRNRRMSLQLQIFCKLAQLHATDMQSHQIRPEGLEPPTYGSED